MVRLTLELVERSDQSVNPAQLRQLTLRGNHIEALENLGVTKDHYECIDLSDNVIGKVVKFPRLQRLKSIIFANNHIQRINEDAFENVPALESVVLTKNKFRSFSDVRALAQIPKLERLVLRENEICAQEHYRLFLVYLLRNTKLRFLDFQKVTKTEKERAKKLFEEDDPELFERIAPLRVSKEEELSHARDRLTAEQKQRYHKLISETVDQATLDKLSGMFERGEAPPEDEAEAMEVEE